MMFSTYTRSLRKYWWIVLAALVVGTLAGFAAFSAIAPKYSATARQFVGVEYAGSATTQDLASANSFARQSIVSYLQLARSEVVLAPVAEEAGISMSVAALRAAVSAGSPKGSTIVEITATSASPAEAAAIANAVSASLANVIMTELEAPALPTNARVQVTTVDSASVPTKATSPDARQIVGTGAVLGLLVGLASVWALALNWPQARAAATATADSAFLGRRSRRRAA